MTQIAISVGAAVIPALVLMFWFWKSDRFPEPSSAVWGTFFYGIAIVFPILFIAKAFAPFVFLINDPLLKAIAKAFFLAAVPEDVMKFCVLYFYCARLSHFNEPMDGIVYGSAASMGFAALENIQYVLGGGIDVAYLRALTAVPGHCANGIIMGYFIALYEFSCRDERGEKTKRGNRGYLIIAIVMPVFLHTLYDFPLMLPVLDYDTPLDFLIIYTFVALILEIGIAFSLYRRVYHLQRTTPITSM